MDFPTPAATPAPSRAGGGYRFQGGVLVTVLFVLLFVPKLNVVALPGFTIQAKPEDVLWLTLLPLFMVGRLRISGLAAKAWLLLMLYLALSALWAPSNALLVLRLLFYSFPILYALELDAGHRAALFRLTRAFFWCFALVAILQAYTPFPYLHTGELLMGPVDRASGIYGNGVEFALIAFMAFWLLVILGDRSLVTWGAAIAIAYLSGTRVVMAMLLLSGVVYLQAVNWRSLGAAALAAAAILAVAWGPDSGMTQLRFAQVDLAGATAAFRDVAGAAQGSRDEIVEAEGYCFEFDNSLFDDQSLAMRLSKLLFVVENVVLGAHPLGFGLGRCIGDAGDNLYVRVLSDGGIPYLCGLVLFLFAMAVTPVAEGHARRNWRLFVAAFAAVSVFYDTLYFSRVAPILFIIMAVALRARPETTRDAM